jgi:hypothetical protein
LWEGIITDDEVTLPGNIVFFDGIVYPLQWAAGNHYYQVASIHTLEKVANPTKERVKELIEGFGYCEVDEDCKAFYGECPFGCWQVVNTKYVDIAQKMIKSWVLNNPPQCMYGCEAIGTPKCEQYKCVW